MNNSSTCAVINSNGRSYQVFRAMYMNSNPALIAVDDEQHPHVLSCNVPAPHGMIAIKKNHPVVKLLISEGIFNSSIASGAILFCCF